MDQQQIPPEQADRGVNLLGLLMVMVKRKRLIIAITLVAAVASVGYSLYLPNIYTATAKVLPPQKEGGNLSAALGQLGGLAAAAGLGTGFGGSAELYVSLLKSRSVADSVIKQLDLMKEFKAKSADEARRNYAGIMKVQSGIKDGVITITADHKKPEMAAKLVNVTVEELVRRSMQLNLAKISNDRFFLEKRLSVVKMDLKKAEDDVKSFAQKNKAIKVDAQVRASIEQFAKLKAELVSREVQLAAIRSYQTDESPEIQSLMAAMDKLRKELGVIGGSGGGKGEAIPSLGDVPSLELEFSRKVREVSTQWAILEQLTKQYELAKINGNRETSDLQILDDAVVPDRKSMPKRSLIVILSTITAFLVAVFAAFILEYYEKSPEEDKLAFAEIKKHLFSF